MSKPLKDSMTTSKTPDQYSEYYEKIKKVLTLLPFFIRQILQLIEKQ